MLSYAIAPSISWHHLFLGQLKFHLANGLHPGDSISRYLVYRNLCMFRKKYIGCLFQPYIQQKNQMFSKHQWANIKISLMCTYYEILCMIGDTQSNYVLKRNFTYHEVPALTSLHGESQL